MKRKLEAISSIKQFPEVTGVVALVFCVVYTGLIFVCARLVTVILNNFLGSTKAHTSLEIEDSTKPANCSSQSTKSNNNESESSDYSGKETLFWPLRMRTVNRGDRTY